MSSIRVICEKEKINPKSASVQFIPSILSGFASAKDIFFDVTPSADEKAIFFNVLQLSPTVKLDPSGEVTMRFSMDCIVKLEDGGNRQVITINPVDEEHIALFEASNLICVKMNGKVERQMHFKCEINRRTSLNPDVSDR